MSRPYKNITTLMGLNWVLGIIKLGLSYVGLTLIVLVDSFGSSTCHANVGPWLMVIRTLACGQTSIVCN